MVQTLAQRIEALLFSEGGPVTKKKLAQLLESDAAAIQTAAAELSQSLHNRGVALIETETELAFAVAPHMKDTVEKAYEKELGREIGDAGLEVLSIILYRGPSTRSRIDYIRGVNTSSTIRTLTARGLIERTQNPHDQREYLYRPTAELLAHLGVRNAEELPDYAKIASELAAFEVQSGPFEVEHAGESKPTESSN
ncbi:MAG TPA: SMC-Scp complex subunit ScpB [Candidatus Paceibacterota bacterium]